MLLTFRNVGRGRQRAGLLVLIFALALGLLASRADPPPPVAANETVARLAKALDDDNPQVRKRAAAALGRLGLKARPAVPALERLLADRDEDVRAAAATALDAVDPLPQPRAKLLRTVRDPNQPAPRRREACAELARRFPEEPEVRAALAACLSDPDVHDAAAAALASTRPAAPAAVGPRRAVLQELPSTGWGTLEGRVTLDGPAPEGLIKEMNARLTKMIERSSNKDVCLAAPESQKTQQVWRISKDGGVGNVVVWLRPPEGFFFKVDRGHPTWPQDLVLDQPHCAFVPHVMVLFPSYYDPQTRKHRATGQRFTIRNGAPINHNVHWTGSVRNPGDNVTMPPGRQRECSVEPDYQVPVSFRSNIHPWMSAYAWAFDHPYAAVTREDGTYRIPHVPTGVDLQVVAWHEPDTFLTAGGAKGETVRLKDGANTLNFKLRAPLSR